MLHIEEMKQKAEERGYTLHNKTADNSRFNFVSLETGVGLIVYPNSDEFEIYYNVNLCITLQNGKAGSFMNDNHFNKLERMFMKYVTPLKEQEEKIMG